MATTLRFVLLGDDRANRAFDSFARSVDRANVSVARNETALKKQSKASQDAQSGLLKLMGTVTGFGDVSTAASGKSSLLAKSIAAIALGTGPAEAAVSALVGTVGSLTAGLTAGGIGLAAYGAAAVPVLGRVQDLLKKQTAALNGSKTAQAAYRKELAATPKPVREFATELSATEKRYKSWANSLAVPVLRPLREGLKAVNPLLREMRPFVRDAAAALNDLATQAVRAVRSSGFQEWLARMRPLVYPVLVDLGHALGNIVVGFGHITAAFAPFAKGVFDGLTRLTAKFRSWSADLGQHSGFQAMIAQWKNSWPAVKEAMGQALEIIVNIVKAWASMTTGGNSAWMWNVANPLLALLRALSGHPALVQVLTYLYLIGQGARQIQGVFGSLKSGWEGITKFLSMVTGGKVQLGMQAAGDTMMAASENMQRAADTMAGASEAGAAGKAAGGAERAGAGGIGARMAAFVSSAAGAAAIGVAIGAGLNWLSARAAPRGTAAGRTSAAIEASGFGGVPGLQVVSGLIAKATELVAGGRGGRTAPPGAFQPGRGGVYMAGATPAWAAAQAKSYATAQAAAQAYGRSIRQALGGTAAAADRARTAIGTYGQSISQMGTLDDRTIAARKRLLSDMEQTGVKAAIAQRDVSRYTQAVVQHGTSSDQARAARLRLIGDIEKAFKDSQQGRVDMDRLRRAVVEYGTGSDDARNARMRLIKDLEKSGLDAQTARDWVNRFSTAIQRIPPGKEVHIEVSGMGRFTIKQVESLSRPGGKLSGPQGSAKGEFLHGYGGGDKHLRLLEAGEAVVSKETTRAHYHELRSWGVPGMASGGLVGTDHFRKGTPPALARWTEAEVNKTATDLVNTTGAAMQHAVRHAMRQLVGSGAMIVDFMRRFIGKVPYVWGGDTPSGWDCSGLVSWAYRKFGIFNGRMTAAGFQNWAQPGRQPGGMVFFGRPAYHIGLYAGGNRMIAAADPQLGTIWDTVTGNSGFGIPPGGFGRWSGGAGPTSVVNLGREMAGRYGWGGGGQWRSLYSLWQGESGWNPNAVNPSSGAWGIPQALPGSKMASFGADWRTNPATQIGWGLNYIRQVYQNPERAYGLWLSRSPHWYERGSWRVPATGPAMVHKNEMILPAAMADAVRKALGGGVARGPLLHVDNMNVQSPTDAVLIAQQVSHRLLASGGMGGNG